MAELHDRDEFKLIKRIEEGKKSGQIKKANLKGFDDDLNVFVAEVTYKDFDFSEAPKTTKEVARLYGEKAKKLKDGQILKVRMTSIEGHDVAILEDEN